MTSNLAWEFCGEVNIVDGRPAFPSILRAPGLYRFHLRNGWWYFGETKDLGRRLPEYGWPGQGVESEHRIYHALIEGGGATLELYTQGDLSTKSNRCVIESREINKARAEGKSLLNGVGRGAAFALKMSIKYHEIELARLRSQLKALSAQE